MMISFVLNYGIKSNNQFWKVIIGLPMILSFVSNLIFHIIFKNETPQYYMITKNDSNKAKETIYSLYQNKIAKEEFEDLLLYQQQYYKFQKLIGYRDLFRPRYLHRTILIIFFTMAFCYSGTNIISIYSYSIIKINQNQEIAQLFTSIIPIGDIVGPFIAIILINRLGRKRLYILGLFFSSVFLILFSIFGWIQLTYLQKYMILAYKFILGMSSSPVHWSKKKYILSQVKFYLLLVLAFFVLLIGQLVQLLFSLIHICKIILVLNIQCQLLLQLLLFQLLFYSLLCMILPIKEKMKQKKSIINYQKKKKKKGIQLKKKNKIINYNIELFSKIFINIIIFFLIYLITILQFFVIFFNNFQYIFIFQNYIIQFFFLNKKNIQ
ncbi:hypothetical protein IMG5_098160 [Ichthyophthirius multifiliis]|uniref:Major facilitator superfamily protein n=1 Tax=Ichthyophthirius multifiliis TaxID=5932 RepID=G0QS21_ICHMU|nr:hypothetical protein IMG5_098160 [Ichthyophthirius multifiliis]EGR31990.1 hypothetical protein IMG5_098160 [Ichthyophthirius multifiliis]|eukprot:XP_004035476.1 hypothetical protein IMG5_098160 [Ichthyophthirius multifiliis]